MKTKIYLVVITLLVGLIGGVFISDYLLPKEKEIVYIYEDSKELTGWQLLEMAIIKTESNFNTLAIGTHGDLGPMQITKPYIDEVNRILDTVVFVHTDAFNIYKTLDMFNIYQNSKNIEHDVEKAINLHNPKGNSIGYAEKVLENFRYLSQYEEIRSAVVKYE